MPASYLGNIFHGINHKNGSTMSTVYKSGFKSTMVNGSWKDKKLLIICSKNWILRPHRFKFLILKISLMYF